MGEWWNGIHERLKISCPSGREGSTPSSPTIGHKERPYKLNARKAIFSGKPEITNLVKNERAVTHTVV